MTTSRALRAAIKTAEWSRYTGDVNLGYARAGTTGKDAVELRCPLQLCVTDPPFFIEYRSVGDTRWYPTGYAAVMSYDRARDHVIDNDGYEFIPYQVTKLQKVPIRYKKRQGD